MSLPIHSTGSSSRRLGPISKADAHDFMVPRSSSHQHATIAFCFNECQNSDLQYNII